MYLALKASLTRFPINNITLFEKIVIGTLLTAFPLAAMAIYNTGGLMIAGVCVPFQTLQNLILAIFVDGFWNFSCMALFNIPLSLHAKSIKKDNANLKKLLQRNLLGCIIVVILGNASFGLMIASIHSPDPWGHYVSVMLCFELVVDQLVAWQQTQKKHENESSTAAKQSGLSNANGLSAVKGAEGAEDNKYKSSQVLVASTSQSPLVSTEPMTPTEESTPLSTWNGVTPTNQSRPTRETTSSSVSSLPSSSPLKEEPRALAHRVPEDEAEDS